MRSQLFINATTFLGRVWHLSRPYWRSEERWRARGLLAAILVLTLGLVYLAVLFNNWNREFYNSLEQKNFKDFTELLLYFSFLAAIYIAAAVYKTYLTQMLEMRWRVWLTRQYLGEWLDRQVYYRLELAGQRTDNPDQRIADDLRMFTEGTLTLSLDLLTSAVTLVSFVAILWNISGPLSFATGAGTVTIPGYMVWVAAGYAVAASVLTYFIGRPLIKLYFQKERREADFRFNMVRLRENAEGVALYHGEAPEQQGLLNRFELIRQNWWSLMHYTKRLTYFTAGYRQIAVVFPFVVAAPRFFSGAITLGGLTQIASAFGEVQGALSWFVNAYSSLAEWKASVDRLLTFKLALEQAAREAAAAGGVQVDTGDARSITVQHLELALPAADGAARRTLLADTSFAIEPASRTLITGPSGSGKTTLFRALAGIWPYGRGTVSVPKGARVLFLPQKPYLPLGTLRNVVTFPAEPGAFDDDIIRSRLADCRLEHFADRLEEENNWALVMSGGEQQRLAIARALLNQPDWLFLDEATASLDEAVEAHLYALLREQLPNTALVSIAHRPTVAAYHDRRWRLEPGIGAMRLAVE
jgi:vitamin B12/bleomycin/antimicrobial peptide transport system ATP-binding/permease protein